MWLPFKYPCATNCSGQKPSSFSPAPPSSDPHQVPPALLGKYILNLYSLLHQPIVSPRLLPYPPHRSPQFYFTPTVLLSAQQPEGASKTRSNQFYQTWKEMQLQVTLAHSPLGHGPCPSLRALSSTSWVLPLVPPTEVPCSWISLSAVCSCHLQGAGP